MISEHGTIISVEPAAIVVEVDRSSACSSCESRGMCGTTILSNLFRRRSNAITVAASGQHFRLGDRVLISIAERKLVLASIVVYGLPLLTMIAGSIFAQIFFDRDFYTASAGVLALIAGMLVSSGISRSPRFGITATPQVRRLEPVLAESSFDRVTG